MSVYCLFYNHDDNYDIETLQGIYTTLDKAKAEAQQEHKNYEDNASPLIWERLDWKTEAYEAFRDNDNERYFQIVVYEVE